jgi:hypothetical protein
MFSQLDLPLHTFRLLLRDFIPADFQPVHAYASDPDVTRFMLYGPRDEADTAAYLQRMLHSQGETPRRTWELAVIRRVDARLIGACDLTLEDEQAGDLGYIFAREAWGQGLCQRSRACDGRRGVRSTASGADLCDVCDRPRRLGARLGENGFTTEYRPPTSSGGQRALVEYVSLRDQSYRMAATAVSQLISPCASRGCVNFRATMVRLITWIARTWVTRLPSIPSTGSTSPDGSPVAVQVTTVDGVATGAAEARSRGKGFEPTCRPVALLQTLMILLQMIIQVAVRPVRHPLPEDVPNGAWVCIMAIR